jgi:hypothetical protein
VYVNVDEGLFDAVTEPRKRRSEAQGVAMCRPGGSTGGAAVQDTT